jgi:hypothetical protein
MKNSLLFTAVLIFSIFTASYGQNMVINGDFENNKATSDMINCNSIQFDTLMSNVYSFGTWTNPDIIESNGYCNWPEHKKWDIALTGGGTDDVAMQLSQPIIAGNKYVVSFWDEGCDFGLFGFEVGISTNDSTFGSVVYQAPTCVNGTWTHRIDTFTAPISGAYLTFQGQVGWVDYWGQLDNVTLITTSTPSTASFNMPSSACANQSATITYNGNGNSTDSYIWNFGSGNVLSGSGVGPYQVLWSAAGTYNISLTVIDSAGDTATTTNTIVVNAVPTSSFTLDASIAAGQTDLVNYTGNGSASATYSWNVNNAFIENNNGDTSYNLTWATPGIYNVTLIVSQNGCSSTTQQSVTVVNPLTVATPICTDSISMISYSGFIGDTSIYNWSFSGANIIAGSGAGPYTLQYKTPGSYPVSLSVTIDSVNYIYTDTIVVSSSGACSNTVKDTVINANNHGKDTTMLTTGINTTKNLMITNMYPNPTMGNLNITLQTLHAGSIHIDVYDVLGRTIFSNYKNVSANDNTITLSTTELPAGSYFIRLSDDNSNFSDTQKFIKLL